MQITISEYLIRRLNEINVDTLFGIPGDYVLPFFDQLIDGEHGVEHVLARNELNGAYSADGYAKLNGFGAMAVTFGVGALNATNAVAGAYADDTPIILIAGTPATKVICEPTDKLYHHVIGNNFDVNLEVFKSITCSSQRIMLASAAAEEIDAMLRLSMQTKKPCYLEIPYDLQTTLIDAPTSNLDLMLNQSSAENLQAALNKTYELLKQSETRSVVVGHLLSREFVVEEALQVVEQLNAATATTFNCKLSDFEDHPNSVGIYMGQVCETYTKEMVEGADVAITLGVTNNEFDTGVFSSKIGENQAAIHAEQSCVKINGKTYDEVYLREFVPALLKIVKTLTAGKLQLQNRRKFAFERGDKFEATDNILTIDRLFIQFSNYFKPNDVVFGDTGGFINCSQTEFPRNITMHGCGNWGSLGSGFGMFVGATFSQAAANQRLITVQGEGAFNMTAQELSTLIAYKKDLVLFILDNAGYGAERAINPGVERSYNDIPVWSYENLATALGGIEGDTCHSYVVKTEKEMDELFTHLESPKGVNVVRIMLEPNDSASFNLRFSEALRH
jgi:indolepyruvate decarboxylase